MELIKKHTFIVNDEQFGAVITGDVSALLDYMRSYLAEMKDGDEITFEIRRHDMTEAEIETAPVQ